MLKNAETCLKQLWKIAYCIFFSWNTSEHISATLLNISETSEHFWNHLNNFWNCYFSERPLNIVQHKCWTISEHFWNFLINFWNPYFTSWSKICSEKILNIFQHHCWTNLKHLKFLKPKVEQATALNTWWMNFNFLWNTSENTL